MNQTAPNTLLLKSPKPSIPTVIPPVGLMDSVKLALELVEVAVRALDTNDLSDSLRFRLVNTLRVQCASIKAGL